MNFIAREVCTLKMIGGKIFICFVKFRLFPIFVP